MHPEIKKFWETSNHEVIQAVPIGSISDDTKWRELFYIREEQTLTFVVCISEIIIGNNIPNNYTYYFLNQSKPYSEEEALRLVKLKAFL